MIGTNNSPLPPTQNEILSGDSDDESEKLDNTDRENDLLESELKEIHELKLQPLDDGNDDDSDNKKYTDL